MTMTHAAMTAGPSLIERKRQEIEAKRQEIEREVCALYREVSAAEPAASWHKRSVIIAAQTGLSPEGIKVMLKRNGISNPNSRKRP